MATQEKTPSFGPLEGLIGTWVGVKGWSVISVPAPGSTPDGTAAFKLIVQNYSETLTFKAVDDPVRNRGGALEQNIGAVEYEQRIHDLDTKALIHVENGMLMYLGDIESETDDEAPAAKFSIARSATIPHGDSAMILGDSVVKEGKIAVPDISSLPSTLDMVGAPVDFLDQYDKEQKRLTVDDIVMKTKSKIFNVTNPNENLQRDNNGLEVLKTTHMHLDSENEGGINNVPFIVRHANATRFQCDFWLQTIKLPMSGQTFEQLQYSQNVALEFHKKFSGEPGLIRWPHVTVNTLTKQ
ncbi:heme-binding protein [Thalassomonas sp. RHCl1]|uniref:heme-binding protein n=1 Tax=Thalassomonas sp. RHCl1 TaxID=2995320 RepID=UPI00248C635D|nr:heme-binding protein [Thalassomonas sp. RHCl1]